MAENKLDEVSGKIKLKSTNRLTNLKNKYRILNGTKYFSSGVLQIY